jgi:hypothetical protein
MVEHVIDYRNTICIAWVTHNIVAFRSNNIVEESAAEIPSVITIL